MTRLNKLRQYLKENKLESILISAYENYRYFAGFTGSNAYLVITENDLILITDQRYTEQAQQQSPEFKVITHGLNPFITLEQVLDKLAIKEIAFESKQVTDYTLRNLKAVLPTYNFIPTEDVGKEMRKIKDESEIEALQQALKIADLALMNLIPFIKAGRSENEIAIQLEHLLALGGSETPAFGTIVASGVRSSLPHGKPSDKLVEDGDLIVIDYAARYQGYLSDTTRTVQVGQTNGELQYVFDLVQEALNAAIAGVKPGVSCDDLDSLAREVFIKANLEQYSLRGLGHGVGLEIHEFPRVVMNSEEKIAENMVFTVEPGLYLPNKGGVRLEDIVRVTKNGCDILTKVPRQLKV